MEKHPVRRNRLRSSIILRYYIILVFSFAFVSCGHQSRSHPQNFSIDKRPAAGIVHKPATPRVTLITARNHPKIIKAGKPVIKTEASGRGLPFFTNYGTDQGLADDFVTCILQHHSKGVLYVAGNQAIFVRSAIYYN